MNPDEARMVGARFTGSPLTKCAPPAHTPPATPRPALNLRLLASGIAWGNTDHKRRWR